MARFKRRPVVAKGLSGHEGTIGIAGACPAVGVTHLSVGVANYLTAVRQMRTAVLEWSRQEAFGRMERLCVGHDAAQGPFCVLGVDYYKSAGTAQLLECRSHGYDRILLDFGVLSDENQDEFLRCGQRLAVGAFTEWQVGAFLEMAGGRLHAEKKDLLYMAAFGSEEIRKSMMMRLKLDILRIPVSVDAFTVPSEAMAFFDRWIL